MRIHTGVVLVAAAVVLAGCTVRHTRVVHTTSTTVITRIVRPPSPTPSPAPRPARPAVFRPGSCPYLRTRYVMDTIGQHVGHTEIAPGTPPTCAFFRPDGGRSALVAVSTQPSARAAQRASVVLTGRGAEPLSDVGAGGTVQILTDGTLLAAYRDRILVTVRINQQNSLEASLLAQRVFATLSPPQ